MRRRQAVRERATFISRAARPTVVVGLSPPPGGEGGGDESMTYQVDEIARRRRDVAGIKEILDAEFEGHVGLCGPRLVDMSMEGPANGTYR